MVSLFPCDICSICAHPSLSTGRIYCVNIFQDFVMRIPTINALIGGFEDDPAKLEDFIDAVSGYMRLFFAVS
jgi:hypothetical protein